MNYVITSLPLTSTVFLFSPSIELTAVIKAMREKHHIVGTPVGTLQQLPTQNIFLGIPFEYTPEEIALLAQQNAITVLNGPPSIHKVRTAPRSEKPLYNRFIEFPKDWHRQGRLLPEPPAKDPPDANSGRVLSTHVPPAEGVLFRAYKHLHEAGYWLSPGLRFGCDFNAYPGDPLRYHSHFMVHVEKDEREGTDMLALVAGGRVATQTRKAWVLAGEVERDIRIFTIEWAGFG